VEVLAISSATGVEAVSSTPVAEEIASTSTVAAAPTAPTSVTIRGKSYEVRQAHGLWEFRASPDAGWTACSKGMVGLIEKEVDNATASLSKLARMEDSPR